MCSLPREVLERILYYCDGKTLKNAKSISSEWHSMVDYLTERTDVWEWCCKEDIPQHELATYVSKYEDAQDDDKWLNIYDTWLNWHDIKNNIHFDRIVCPVEVSRITSVAVSGNFIAVGSDDGRVHLYNKNWSLLCTVRYQAVRIINLGFIDDDYRAYAGFDKPLLLIAYNGGTIIINEYDGRLNEIEAIQDVTKHSMFKDYLCYEKRGGRISIVKLHRNINGKFLSSEMTYMRIYSSSEVSFMHITHKVATLLLNNEVKIIKYNDTAPITTPEHKTKLPFTIKNLIVKSLQMFHDDIIFSVSSESGSLSNEFLELFILGDNGCCSHKLFNCWEVFEANITCMYLYGSILVIGVDIGDIYFYRVSSWRSFNLRNYEKRIVMGRHPILGISATENKYERTFYISTTFSIHKIVCYRGNVEV